MANLFNAGSISALAAIYGHMILRIRKISLEPVIIREPGRKPSGIFSFFLSAIILPFSHQNQNPDWFTLYRSAGDLAVGQVWVYFAVLYPVDANEIRL
jgi:hypothetical protein